MDKTQDKAEYLRAKGWVEHDDPSPWRWTKAPYNGAFYTLREAYELQQAMDRNKGEKNG